MKRVLLSLAFIMTILVVNAQKIESQKLIGNWVFSDIPAAEKEKLDERGKQMMIMMFGNFKLNLQTENKYHGSGMAGEEDGTWSLKGNTVTLVAATGKENSFEILKMTDDTFTMKFGRATLIMKKVAK